MSVKYSFWNGPERLFDTAFDFATEQEKGQILRALQRVLGERVRALRSFGSSQSFDAEDVACLLTEMGIGPAEIKGFHKLSHRNVEKTDLTGSTVSSGEAEEWLVRFAVLYGVFKNVTWIFANKVDFIEVFTLISPCINGLIPVKVSNGSGVPFNPVYFRDWLALHQDMLGIDRALATFEHHFSARLPRAKEADILHRQEEKGPQAPSLPPMSVQHTPAQLTEGMATTIFKIWVGDELLCDSPLDLKGMGRCRTVVRALQDASQLPVRFEAVTGDSLPDNRETMSDWVAQRPNINLRLFRERLGFRGPLPEVELKAWREEQHKQEQERQKRLQAEQALERERCEQREREAQAAADERLRILEELSQRRRDEEHARLLRAKAIREDAEHSLPRPITGAAVTAVIPVQQSYNSASTREERIKHLIEARGIQQLMHFTRIENLPQIAEYGLQSRAALGNDGYIWTDNWRRDNRTHAICLSISYPNYKMFFHYRQRKGGHWAVLLLDPCLLWERDCGFVEVNAAAGDICMRSEASLKTVTALEKMFENNELRKRLLLPPHYTTNPQAEVLVFEPIPQTYIEEIHVDIELDEPLQYNCEGHIIPVKTDNTYFRARDDYDHWRNPSGS